MTNSAVAVGATEAEAVADDDAAPGAGNVGRLGPATGALAQPASKAIEAPITGRAIHGPPRTRAA